ncbi:PIN domain-containing protein [Collinsella tanakaei]|nr:PIN domain-containing protein [Collinsella tanakaei]
MRDCNSRRVLFDTNIPLDAVCRTRPDSDAACEVLKLCNGGGDMGLVTSGSLKDSYYVLERQYGEARARQAISWLMDLLVIAPVGAEECEMSLHSNEPDFEDGLVRACAELNDVDFILARDKDAFRKSPVRAVTCPEYLETRS